MDKLKELARLIRQRNEIAREIGALIGRPALVGHIGEWIAQEVFSMRLEDSAVQKGFDGRFCAGPLVGKTVNVKWYGKREGLLDVNPDGVPDLYLVMTGPKSPAGTSRGGSLPWVIADVFLFDGPALVERLRRRGVKLGVATSVRGDEWEAARIYPVRASGALLDVTERQRRLLSLFQPSE